MKPLASLAGLITLLGAVTAASASPVLYTNIGTPAPYVPIYATASGDLLGTSIFNGGGGDDKIRLFDVTTATYSAYGLDNKTTPIGGVFDFGHVNAGDLLSFEIWNSDDQARLPGLITSTDPYISQDGFSHAFVSVDDTFVYLSMEDLSPYGGGGSDFNYHDPIFGLSVNQVAALATPEPGSLALVGTGLLTAMGALRRSRSL